MLSIRCNSRVELLRNKNRSFINWEGINIPSQKNDWRKTERSHLAIVFNVLYAKKEKHISCLCFIT